MTRRSSKSTPKIKHYRSLYAKAKRAGLVKGDKDARSFVPSKYMKTKLNKISEYLTPEYTTVKPSKTAYKLYRAAPNQTTPFAAFGRVVVRNDPKTKAEIRKGFIARIRRLKNGTAERIILPITPQDLRDFAELVKKHPEWDDILKVTTDDPDTSENFAFMFFGNPSLGRYGSMEALADALENMYLSRVDPDDHGWFTNMGKYAEAPYVELYREYKDWDMAPVRHANRVARARERNENFMRSLTQDQRNKRALQRSEARQFQPSYIEQLAKRKQERKEKTPEQRAAELEKARIRMRKNRAKAKK